jgi:hypothetical protein
LVLTINFLKNPKPTIFALCIRRKPSQTVITLTPGATQTLSLLRRRS